MMLVSRLDGLDKWLFREGNGMRKFKCPSCFYILNSSRCMPCFNYSTCMERAVVVRRESMDITKKRRES
jgi:hypothetical protein